MVSTRSQQSANRPAPSPSPSKPATTTPTTTATPSSPTRNPPWAHTPSNLTLLWLLVSVPLVAWDTAYVLLRPYSMPGGALHAPLWAPYALYGTVDHVYGWPAYVAHDGFPAAQASLNVVESVLYAWYLSVVFRFGRAEAVEGRGAPGVGSVGWLGAARVVRRERGGWVVLVGFGAAVMTVAKTVLYWLNEHYSGYAHIGHNDFWRLLVLWIIPNGAWIVLPSYMVYVFGQEILQGLAIASGTAGAGNEVLSRKER